MITRVSETDFIDAFQAIRPDNFTYSGLKALYAYFEELSDDIGNDIEFDVIGICCDFVEYKNIDELNNDYATIHNGITTVYTVNGNEYNGKNWEIKNLYDYTTVIPISEEYTAMDIKNLDNLQEHTTVITLDPFTFGDVPFIIQSF